MILFKMVEEVNELMNASIAAIEDIRAVVNQYTIAAPVFLSTLQDTIAANPPPAFLAGMRLGIDAADWPFRGTNDFVMVLLLRTPMAPALVKEAEAWMHKILMPYNANPQLADIFGVITPTVVPAEEWLGQIPEDEKNEADADGLSFAINLI